jgi:hypothetical protein
MTYLIFILYAFVGFVFTVILMDDLLIGYKRYLVSSKAIPEWLKKPLGLCSVCFTGQLSLWGMIPWVTWTVFGIFVWIGIICLNITIVYILTQHYAEKN